MARIRKRKNRRGIATSECAVCLPILVLLTLGTIETCGAIFLKEAITIAAYEGARVGIQRGSTDEIVESRIKEFLDERRIKYDAEKLVSFSDPTFDLTGKGTPLSFNSAQDLEHVTTTVVVPCKGNTFTGWFFSGKMLSARVTLRKEFGNP